MLGLHKFLNSMEELEAEIRMKTLITYLGCISAEDYQCIKQLSPKLRPSANTAWVDGKRDE